MKKMYINGIGSISAQKADENVFLENAVLNENSNVLPIQPPVYKDYISPTAIRRMAKGVKNGTVASAIAIKEANVDHLDAIITGTGLGCVEDSDKFLRALLDNNEQFLTPTSFIQSTHNTVGSQIALGLQCKAYNFTYVNAAVSFESSVLDAKMMINNNEASTILIGGVDEMNDYTASLFKICGFIKKDTDAPFKVLNTNTPGAIYSEGATFFVVQDKITPTTYAEIIDVEMTNTMEISEVSIAIQTFLKNNNTTISDIDAVILGFNGDVIYDDYYNNLCQNIFAQTPQLYYKHLCGEYNTASAYGLCIGAQIIKTQQVPNILKVNSFENANYKKILLYNQYRGLDHSFTLITQC